MVTVTIRGEQKQVQEGTAYEAIVSEYQKEYGGTIAVVSVNGKIRELFKRVSRDCEVDFFTLRDDVGHKTYVRTATMLFLKGIHDVFGAEAARKSCVEFTIGRGIYVNTFGEVPVSEKSAERIMERMGQLSEANEPFMKHSYPIDDAVALFREKGMEDKVKLFHYRMSSSINVYEIDGYCDYYYGYMLPNAGYVRWYDVVPYKNGFMLVLPTQANPTVVEPFTESKKLFQTMENAMEWGRTAGIETVGDLNDQICNGSMSDLILVQEAEQERKIGEIAKDIAGREGVKFVMIAGPSSSGKTSFSHRLSIQLRTLGKIPRTIALDNYFVNREQTPRDENGDYNFECLEAIDVKLFNDNMVSLLAGERVEIPAFNFKTGQREYRGDFMQLGENDILVLEGIHGLNEKMSYALPEDSKYKIYISALTTLNVDGHNRIPTTDGRLLRRMVRDARTRGASAQRTIQMWHSVRRGEEENIFPFQEEADAMFNSALIYELAMLKTFAEPLLFQIPKEAPEYYEAKRLLKFLDYFLSVPSESLPNNSICREFVGGSCFNV
ncbi:MAG: nucleoside kinase [Lachnospiraceae bacterium]|nr:nucleoside kinase [Lachnospiraceae bacterium]